MAQWQVPHKQEEGSLEPSKLLGILASDACLEAQELAACRGRRRDPASEWKVRTDT